MAVARKVSIEVEVPAGTDLEELRRVVKRAVVFYILEKSQRRVPSEEEVEELAREAKVNIYRSIVEAGE